MVATRVLEARAERRASSSLALSTILNYELANKVILPL